MAGAQDLVRRAEDIEQLMIVIRLQAGHPQ